MDPARIAELLAPFLQAPPGPPASLNDAQLGQVSAYLDLLLRWNARINLTAVRDAESMVTRHFGESFFAADSGSRCRSGSRGRKSALESGAGRGARSTWAPAPASPDCRSRSSRPGSGSR